MDSMYVVFSKPNTIISRLIKIFTKNPYTHVGVALNDPKMEFYSFARRHEMIPLPGGFVTEKFTSFNYQSKADVPVAIIKIPISSEQKVRLESMIEYFQKNDKRYNYNLIGLFLCGTGLTINRSNHYFCSEFTHYVLAELGICERGVPSQHVKPADLFKMLEDYEVIHQGNVTSFLSLKEAL